MAHKKTVKRKVERVVDGDTFKVRKGVEGSQYIRIAGRNSPEKGEKGYQAAKKELSSKVAGRTVTLRPVGKSYGRTVAEVPFVQRKKKR